MDNFKIDFLGIGAEKAATYWLAAILREHPEICFSNRKEITFFNEYDQHFLKIKNPRYDWGMKWYKKHFDKCSKTKLKGEITPTYLYSKITAQRIKKHFPDVKLIVCLRDPVKRAFSQYIHDRSIGLIERKPFDEILKTNDSYTKKSLYYKYLKNYYELFPKNHILVLIVKDIQNNPKKVVKKVYSFLNLKNTDFTPKSLNKRFNVATTSRFWILNYFLIHCEYFLLRYNFSKVLYLLENSGIRKKLFDISYYPNRKPLKHYPEILPDVKKKLSKRFESDINSLERLIGRNLSFWKVR